MKWTGRAVFLSLGLALLAVRPGAAQADVPWAPIETGLERLSVADGKGAAADFVKAKSADGSGLAELLLDLDDAYILYAAGPRDRDQTLEVHERLNVARQYFYQHPIPPATLAEALMRIRTLLKGLSGAQPSPLLRPLL